MRQPRSPTRRSTASTRVWSADPERAKAMARRMRTGQVRSTAPPSTCRPLRRLQAVRPRPRAGALRPRGVPPGQVDSAVGGRGAVTLFFMATVTRSVREVCEEASCFACSRPGGARRGDACLKILPGGSRGGRRSCSRPAGRIWAGGARRAQRRPDRPPHPDRGRISEMAAGVREIAGLEDPVGELVESWTARTASGCARSASRSASSQSSTRRAPTSRSTPPPSA